MKFLLEYASRVISIGTHNIFDLETKHRVRFTNIMFSMGVISLFVFSLQHFYFDLHLAGTIQLINLAILIICFRFNEKGWNNLAPFVALFSIGVNLFFLQYLFKGDNVNQYILLAMTPLASLTIDQRRKGLMLFLLMLLPILGLLILALNFGQYGIYELPFQQAQFLNLNSFIQAGVIVVLESYAFLAEMRKRYNIYLDQETKIKTQMRLSDLGLMTAGIAHEINNPLAIINGSATFLKRKISKGEPIDSIVEKELDRVLGQSQRIIKIIDGLRYISRDARSDNFECLDISQVVEEGFDLFNQNLASSNISTSFLGLKTPCLVNIRAVQIQQVILSIVSNSYDAIKKNLDKRIEIRIDDSDADFVQITIADNGPGIPVELREQIFKPFFTTKPPKEGTGLGLSVASEIIEYHNGSIKFGNPEVGSECIIFLPKAKALRIVA